MEPNLATHTAPCILVAENDVLVRNLISSILNHQGHNVLAAANGDEALELCRTFAGRILLFISSNGRPQSLNGTVLSQCIIAQRPDTRSIVISAATSADLKIIANEVPAGSLGQRLLPARLQELIGQAISGSDFPNNPVKV